MTDGSLNGIRVAIFLGDNFEQVEMTEPRRALEAAGGHMTLVSPNHGALKADSIRMVPGDTPASIAKCCGCSRSTIAMLPSLAPPES